MRVRPMTAAHPMKTARDRFFNDESLERPLQKAGWRGCVLDRDKRDNTRLPEVLWNALVAATTTASEVQVCGYFLGVERCIDVASSWADFSAFMLKSENYSPEYVLFDESGCWAILADTDVTTVVMDERSADVVDAYLRARDSSLLSLTLDDFPKDEILSAGGSYVRGVLGEDVVVRIANSGSESSS